MKRRTHYVIMRVTFDRPCTAAYARREAWDSIYGDFYTSDVHPLPETFKATVLKNRSVPVPTKRKRVRPLKGQMKLPLAGVEHA
jgi:hypothetical protein